MTGKVLSFRNVAPSSCANPVTEAARSVVENLEGRTLFATDPFAFQNTVQPLPYSLDFSSAANGVLDKDGEATGFTAVQINRKGQAISYVPSLIDLNTNQGILKVTSTGNSTSGSNYNGDNTQKNALETMFDATTAGFITTVRLIGPLDFIKAPSQQAGIYVGPDQDNYVKLVAIARDEGPRLQFVDEQTYNGVYTHSLNSIINIGASFKNIQTLDLRLEGDAASGRIRAYYSINGATFVKMPQELQLYAEKRAAFFSTTAKAGILTIHKNDIAPITATFDSFSILPGRSLAGRPTVTRTRPGDTDSNVSRDAFIAADLNLPNGGVDTESLDSSTVKLYRTSDHAIVPGVVNTSGGGDTIVFQPQILLDADTQYTFEITDGVKDVKGGVFIPYQMTFTTSSAGGDVDPSIGFEKVSLPSTFGEQYTSVVMGPEGKNLWAGTSDGKIIKFPINADGTLGTATVITSLQDANVGPRLITGFSFAPGSNESNPTIYVNHGFADIVNSPDWSSKMTRMSGANLEIVQDIIVGLPRAVKDHLTNQPVFGPDGAIYFNQGSESAMGAADTVWGNRSEHLLNAATLRLDLNKLPATLPLNVQTEAGGNYNPFASSAPLTIYADGIRNAWDLVWTSDGKLFTATNGSAAGGNTPGTPSGSVAPMNNIDQTMGDYLFNVQPGGYYGHPNPLRNEYILNGGNPTGNVDPAEVPSYPIGTNPEANYRGAAFSFGLNYSPDGMIEYKNTAAFNGALAGKLMIVRFSGGDDIITLTHDNTGKITQSQTGIAGMRNFVDPLDLVENTSNGFLYVAEYSESDPTQRRITLLRPIPPGAKATADKSLLVFSDIGSSYTGGAGASPNETVKITNTGTVPLSFPSDGFTVIDDASVTGNHAAAFKIANGGSLPDTLGVGESVIVQINFTASTSGIYSAFLQVKSNDVSNPTFKITLRGVGTTGTGGANEPSLARILRAYQIPTIVGDGANDSGEATTDYPNPPSSTSEEVLGARLQKAGAGNITIDLLAIEAKSLAGVSGRFGYYTPGNKADRTELFTTGADAQTLHPSITSGSTTFDPGTGAFSLYGIFPSFADATKDGGRPREVYAEDSLNSWDTANPHKVRFFPLKDANGVVVPNAYIFAFEEYDAAFDSNDVVGIIRNVKLSDAGPEIGLENKDSVPFTNRLVFSRIQNPDNSATGQPNNLTHDTATIMVRNTGTDPLVIQSVTLQGNSYFQITTPVAPNTVIAAGGSLPITVKFISQVGDLKTGTLTINTNDLDEPVTTVQLAGFWQSVSEQNQEPSLFELVQLFGYGTKIVNSGELLTIPGREGEIRRTGDEILSPYWRRSDDSAPVTVRQLNAFHNQGSTADLNYFTVSGTGSVSVTRLFEGSADYGQSILPLKINNSGPAYAQFNPTTTFGWRVDGHEFSDPTMNIQPPEHPSDEGHHVRFWITRDQSGNVIPNTYLMAMDYAGINYDYNDNLFLISNVSPTSAPVKPSNLKATIAGSIKLDWSANTEPNLAGYNVYRATNSAGPFAKINANLLTQNTYNDIFAPVGVTSYYQVKAVDTAGNESLPATVSGLRTGDSVPPAQPTSLFAVGSDSGITLDWADNTESDLAGYRILRSANSNGPWNPLNSNPVTSSNFVDITAPRGVISYYQVVAVDTAGNLSSPATANATRPGDASAAPVAPINVGATAVSSSAVNVTWSASAGATRYIIEHRAAGASTWITDTTLQTTTAYQVTGLLASTAYEFHVMSVNGSGVASAASATATATTQTAAPVAPSIPTGLNGSGVSPTQINLTWTAAANATSYRIERRLVGGTFVEIASGVTATSYQDAAQLTASTTYEYQIRAENTVGMSGYSTVATATTQANPVQNGTFTDGSIGETPAGSTVTINDAIDYDISGGGPNISGNSDGFHFAYKQISGDFDIKVHVTQFTSSDIAAKAGLMVRTALTASSRNVAMLATAGQGFRFAYRPTDGADTTASSSGTVSYPNAYLRLRRVGNTFVGYYSTNGTTWTQVSSTTQSLPSTLYFGMAVTSHTSGALATAKFRELGNVGTTSPSTGAPAAPSSLTATGSSTTQVVLNWPAVSGATSYRIERMNGDGSFSEIKSGVTATTYTDGGRSSNRTYTYRVRAENSSGKSGYSPNASGTTLPVAVTLTNKNLGNATGGSTTVLNANSDYDMVAGGPDIYGTSDNGRFAYVQNSGDFDIRVKVASVSGPDGLKAGLLARSSLNADSKNVFSYATKTDYRFGKRTSTGGSTSLFKIGTAAYPNVWLRLKRSGDTLTGYYSVDGNTWTQTSSTTLSLGSTVYVGLAASSGSSSQTATVQFRGLSWS